MRQRLVVMIYEKINSNARTHVVVANFELNMSTDFNQIGVEYTSVAIAGQRRDYGVLCGQAWSFYETLESQLSFILKADDKQHTTRALAAHGCLDRLRAFFLQLSRISVYAQMLSARPLQIDGRLIDPEPNAMAMLAGDDACFDFESLLFHARAALDRLTAFIAFQHGQRCTRYTKLKNLLKGFPNDPRSSALVQALAKSQALDGVLVDVNNDTALRSVVAHKRSILEERRLAFTIHYLYDGRALIFDSELHGFPLLATTAMLAQEVPFIVLSALGVYEGIQMISKDAFQPNWKNPTVVFSKFLDPSQRGPRFSVTTPLPMGFYLDTQHILPEVMDYAQ